MCQLISGTQFLRCIPASTSLCLQSALLDFCLLPVACDKATAPGTGGGGQQRLLFLRHLSKIQIKTTPKPFKILRSCDISATET